MAGGDNRRRWNQLLPSVVRRNRLMKFGVAICVVIALISAVGVFTYLETTSELETNAQNDYSAMSEQGATELTAWQRERASALTVLATDSVFDDPEATAEIRGYLSGEIGSSAPDTVAYHYLDSDSGEVLATTDRGSTQASLDRIPAVDAGNSFNDVAVSSPYERDGDQLIAFAIAISESHTLVLESHIGVLIDNAVTPTSGSFVSIADETGSTHVTNSPEVSTVSYTDVLPTDHQFDGQAGFVSSVGLESTDQSYLVAYAPVHGTDLTYVLHVPESDAYALSTQISRNIAIIIVIAVGGLGMIGVGIARPTVRQLDQLGDRAQELEAGNLDVDLKTDSVDEIGDLYDSFAAMRDSLRSRITEAEQQRTVARNARQESEAVAERLERRAAAFGDRMEQAANGDLTVRLSAESDDPDALHSIADGFNDAMSELQAMVADVDQFAADVATATTEVTDRVDSVADGATRTSQSVTTIVDGADSQHSQLESVAGDMETMSATIEEVAASSQEVSETSREAAALTDQGQTATTEAVSQLHTIDTRSQSAAETVDQLAAEMRSVEQIVETISEIAAEISILALNANIESSRSGAAGDGFGVVADEIKALANDTQESAAEIESLIETLRERTDDCVDEMQSIRTGVDDGVETVEDAEAVLDRIAQQVDHADQGIQEISTAMDSQATAVSTVSGTVDELAEISHETADEATSVGTTVDQQADTLDAVATQTHDLARQAERLTAMVDSFTVDSAAEQQTATHDQSGSDSQPTSSTVQ